MDTIGYDAWHDKPSGLVTLMFYTHDPVTNGTPWYIVKFYGLDYEKRADEYLKDTLLKHNLTPNKKGEGFKRD